MDPLSISLVHQYLASTNSALADQFRDKYQPQKTSVEMKEVLAKWKEEQLARGLIYQHLETVAPYLAVEFRNRHLCSLEPAPKHVMGEIQKKILTIASTKEIRKVEDGRRGKQERKKTYTTDELVRIKKAIANKEDFEKVAKEIGRSYTSVYLKIRYLQQSAALKKGKFSAEEIERVKRAVTNNEDCKSVATELNRSPESVHFRMHKIKINPGAPIGRKKSFSLQEDLLILDKIILCLKFRKLCSAGLLSPPVLKDLAKETGRGGTAVRTRWETILQPWLLQHYTGTAGFRVERMLTSLVAEKFTDHRGIDWSEIVKEWDTVLRVSV